MSNNNLEHRSATLTIEEGGNQFIGLAATFEPYDMGEFREQIMPTAFENLNAYDVRALVNHDANQLLARSKFGEGTLLLERTASGLGYMFEAPNTQAGADAKELVSRGDITGSSWAFQVKRDSWTMQEDGVPLRQIHEISEMRDISLVTYPANPDTAVALRSMDKAFETEQKSDKMGNTVNVPAPAVHTKNHEFNIVKAVNQARADKFDGIEAELNQEGISQRKAANLDFRQEHGFHFPLPSEKTELRLQSVTGGTQPAEGAELVEEVKLNYIDKLWAGSPFLDRISRFDNLRGDVSFPRDQDVPELAWETETADASAQTSTWDDVKMSPKRAAIAMEISNQLLRQEYSSGIQNRLFNQMSEASRVGLEKALLIGSGVGAEPTGIYTELTAQAISIGAPTYDGLVTMETALANANALKGNLAYITHPAVTGKLKTDRVDAGSGILTVGYSERMRENMTANGYPILSTTVSPIFAGVDPDPDVYGLLFGDLNDFAMGTWSAPSIMVDPYTKMTASTVRLYIEMFIDCAVLRPQSFSLSEDVDIS